MKTPITYYGGKQNMMPQLLPLIPAHKIYTEPFFGGGALFWVKEPALVEVVNDMNGELINFYKEVKTNFNRLNKMIQATLHSRKSYIYAKVMYQYPELFTPVQRAWALWVLSQQSFSGKLGSGWAYGIKGNHIEKNITNKKINFTQALQQRLERTQIECTDALKVIKVRDTADTFHYIDPPYFNANMGHYGGYTQTDFEALLNTLQKVKGSFLLSSYPSPV